MEHGNWLDIVARAALDVFNLATDDGQDYIIPNSAAPSPAPGKSPRSGKKTHQNQSLDFIAKTPPSNLICGGNPLSISSGSSSSSRSSNSSGNNGSGGGGGTINIATGSGNENRMQVNNDDPANDPNAYDWTPTAAWLLAPLVTKLSSAVQGRVLRHSGNVLEAYFKKKSSGMNGNYNGSLQAHLPFLALILTCLRGQDEQREGLLASLLTQFTQILSLIKLPVSFQ